jgi:hypothetical protein
MSHSSYRRKYNIDNQDMHCISENANSVTAIPIKVAVAEGTHQKLQGLGGLSRHSQVSCS